MKTVLLVEDDQFFRDALANALQCNKFNVIIAPDGKSARSILTLHQFDVVVSDIQMPHLTGTELMNWMQENKKQIPVILITGFTQVLETKDAFEMGAAGFLTKPFQVEELIELLKDILKIEEPKPVEEKDLSAAYCKISIDDFVVGKIIPFGIYIKFSDNKFVKIAHRGQDISLDKIKALKQKNIFYLHIRKEDFQQLVGMSLGIMKGINLKSNYSPELKRNFIKYTGEVLLERVFVVGLDKESFNSSKDYIENLVSAISEDDEMHDLIDILNTHSDYLYAHSLAVSTYAVMLAKRAGWNSIQNIYKLSMAGLYHDIGKKEINKDILEKPRHKMTAQERKIYETHPIRGKEILEAIRKMPNEVIEAAYQHHEDMLGMGFPKRLDKNSIHPFTKFVSIANIFSNYVLKGPHGKAVSPKEAIMLMESRDRDKVDPELLAMLKMLVVNS